MKRPLFRAVVAFALGEVTYVLTEGMKRAGIVFTVSAFCALIFLVNLGGIRNFSAIRSDHSDNKEHMRSYVASAFMLIMYFLGLLNMHLDSIYPSVEECIGRSDVYAEGTVADISGSGKARQIYISIYKTKCDLHVHSDNYKLVIYDSDSILHIGDIVSMEGELSHIEKNTNPGAFDRQNYYEARNVKYTASPDKIAVLKTGGAGAFNLYFIKDKMYLLRDWFSLKLSGLGLGENTGIYKGILLGEKSDISFQDKELYKRGGISHVLAISSLHIVLIGGILLGILKRLGIHIYAAGIISFIFVFFYGVMTGFSVAGVRAVTMMLIGLTGTLLGRDYDLLTSLSAAYFVTLLMEPARLMDSASLLSFSAVLGIAVAKYIMRNLLKDRKIKSFSKRHRIRFKLISALVFQASLQLVMLPVTVSIYNELYTYSFLINLIVVPLMTVVVACGFAGLISFFLQFIFGSATSAFIGKIIFFSGTRLLDFFKLLCRLSVRLPFNTICIGHVTVFEVIIYYLFLFLVLLLFSNKTRRKIVGKIFQIKGVLINRMQWRNFLAAALCLLTMASIFSLALVHGAINGEMVIFLDVGQGAGSIIRTEDRHGLLFDGGSATKDNMGVYILLPAIKYMGLSVVDYWFVSHTDADHVSGLLDILGNYQMSGIKIKNIVFGGNEISNENSKKIKKLAAENGINIIYLTAGDGIYGNAFEVCCVHPDSAFSSDDENEYSMAVSYQSENVRVLFTGDMGQKALACMLDKERELLCEKYDYLVIPHHGSKYSFNADLYSLAGEGAAIISCGKNNRYGHPHKEVLEQLNACGCRIYRTDENGAVVLKQKAY